jgi:hypothetical protein
MNKKKMRINTIYQVCDEREANTTDTRVRHNQLWPMGQIHLPIYFCTSYRQKQGFFLHFLMMREKKSKEE